MAAVADTQVVRAPRRSARQRAGGLGIWRWIVLLIAAVFFLLPLIVAFRFAGIKAFGSVISEDGFTSSLGLSVRLGVIPPAAARDPAAQGGSHDPADRHPAGGADRGRPADRPGVAEGHAVPARAGV